MVCWKVTNCTPSWALSIAPAVHYCTHDVLMNTQTTFKSPVVLCWALTGSASWCVRSIFVSSAHKHGAMYKVADLKLGICLLCMTWAEINYEPLVAHSALLCWHTNIPQIHYTLHCCSTSWLAPRQLQPIWSSEENCIHRHTLRKLYNDATSSDKWAHEIITSLWWLLVEVKWSLCRLLDTMHYSLLTTNNPRHL